MTQMLKEKWFVARDGVTVVSDRHSAQGSRPLLRVMQHANTAPIRAGEKTEHQKLVLAVACLPELYAASRDLATALTNVPLPPEATKALTAVAKAVKKVGGER
jgi:hypothetical protein